MESAGVHGRGSSARNWNSSPQRPWCVAMKALTPSASAWASSRSSAGSRRTASSATPAKP